MKGQERIAYANPEFEKVSGQAPEEVEGKSWSTLRGENDDATQRKLGEAVVAANDFVSTFQIARGGRNAAVVAAYSNIIVDEQGTPAFRLAALVELGKQGQEERAEFEQKLREKDTQLLEIQHRVKNNLQMITALLRIEARNAQGRIDTAPFDRLAGRIDSIQLVYKLLSEPAASDEIDLGIYLSEIVFFGDALTCH
jgi:PAS domain S-box-containing protein